LVELAYPLEFSILLSSIKMRKITLNNLEENYLVAQANSLIEARYTITKNEQLLLFAMISLIEPADKEFLNFSITVDQLSLILNIHRKTALREFDKITDRLLSRVIKIPTDQGWEKLQWVSNAKVEGDIISLKFHDDLKPLLLALKATGNFTQVKLGVVVQFRSVYTIRIYQLLKEYKSKRFNFFEFSLTDFRDIMLGKDSKSYPLYKNFRNHIIDVAQRELKTKVKETGFYKSDLNFELETRRTGRKISHLKFVIISQETVETKSKIPEKIIDVTLENKISKPIEPLKLNQPLQTPTKSAEPTKTREITPEIETMKLLGIAENKAFELLDKHGTKYIKGKLAVLGEMQEIQSIKSPSGFLLKAINDDYQSETLVKKSKDEAVRKVVLQKEQEKRLEDYQHKVTIHFERGIKKQFLSTLSPLEKENLWKVIKPQIKYLPTVLVEKGKELESPIISIQLNKHIPNYEERKTHYIQRKMMEKRQELFGKIDDF